MKGLRELHHQDLLKELSTILLIRFKRLLHIRGAGHCMRVSDLDDDLMFSLCETLRREYKGREVYVLGRCNKENKRDFVVSSTKLVELRNPRPDGSLRSALLVFVPNALRTSSEDSFAAATFEDVRVGDVYAELKTHLLENLPLSLRPVVNNVLAEVKQWRWADELAQIRFLSTLQLNGYEPEMVGAALFEFGLVPDFRLVEIQETLNRRIYRNKEAVELLVSSDKSPRRRVLKLELSEHTFRTELGDFLTGVPVEDPLQWTRKIVVDRDCWRFSFDKWPFQDADKAPDAACIEILELNLPVVQEDESDPTLQELAGQQILSTGKKGLSKFSVKFRVDPHPAKVQGLDKFTIQVLNEAGDSVSLSRNQKAWKTKSNIKTITFNKLSKADWDAGWHFVRVTAVDSDNQLIQLLDTRENCLPRQQTAYSNKNHPNESDLFYVALGDEIEVEPTQRAIQRQASLLHALRELQFSAILNERKPNEVKITAIDWANQCASGGQKGREALKIKFGRDGSVHVPVSQFLRKLEQQILAAPEEALCWHVEIRQGVPESPVYSSEWPRRADMEAFFAARRTYFTALQQGNKKLISQAADFSALAPLVLEYTHCYQVLLGSCARQAKTAVNPKQKSEALQHLHALLSLDVILLKLENHRSECKEVALIAPTHPLRALWLAAWAVLGEQWLEESIQARYYCSATRDALLKSLHSINFPVALPMRHGRLYTPVDNVHPFWTLYAPACEDDPRGVLSDVCAALSLSEPAIGGTAIDGAYLAVQSARYLIQHPYVHTLTINAFNAGRAVVLAEMLEILQKQASFAHFNYELRLFVPEPETPGVGEALLELLSGTAAEGGEGGEAFATPASNHLSPKLSIAIQSRDAFCENPQSYPAHLSFLFDLFPAAETGAAPLDMSEIISPVYGLMQDFVVYYDDKAVSWRRQPRHGIANALKKEDFSARLNELPRIVSHTTAMVAANARHTDLTPVITLALNAREKALLHQLHEYSDWVFTIDRNLGIEFFDQAGQGERPRYLVDHNPAIISGSGHNLMITSRSLAEIEVLLQQMLKHLELPHEESHAKLLLDSLRELSGRLAMKLLSALNRRTEALGLALAKLYLAYQGVFHNQLAVPLDAHLELYQALQKSTDSIGETISFKRTDLALFDLNAAARTLNCNLLEVKCYSEPGGISGYATLKASVAEQIRQSENVLREHFDTHSRTPDRPDRLLKSKELADLLDFYFQRALRFDLQDPAIQEESRFFLRTLESGYLLHFTRSALLFDLQKNGADAAEEEHGVEYHRIGIDLIRELLNAAITDDETVLSKILPKLGTARFIARQREHTVSWDTLASVSEDWLKYVPPLFPPAQPEFFPVSKLPSKVEEVNPASVKAKSPGDRAADDKPAQEFPPFLPELSAAAAPNYDVVLGVSGDSAQYGILGETAGRKVALDLNHTHTISLFGVQGGGKSYTLGSVAEMATMPIPHINKLPRPLASVIFHYSPTQDYKPEFTSMVQPNPDEHERSLLKQRYGAEPQALKNVVLLTPADKLETRRAEYPSIQVYPLKFSSAELQASHWKFLMGAVGSQAVYIRQMTAIMRRMRHNLTLQGIRQGVDDSSLPEQLKDLAYARLELAEQYISDHIRLGELIKPGSLIIVDLRDEFIEKDEALGLFVVLLQLFSEAKYQSEDFNKLIVFDECHKYIGNPDLVNGLVAVVREMRHKGASIMIASQDPPSVPVSLIELSSHIILHKFNSPAWLKHIQKASNPFKELSSENMARLNPGEAYVWSNKASDQAFCKGAVKITCRPRITLHGGGTKTAV
ncbi:MAG: ATP-binding protein [Gammaproteobacteria bacterium]|nr:ATP-binding protein [Gammaproteobacteria bacterium]